MSSTVKRHPGSLERSLQWALGLPVVVLLSLTGAALWVGRESAEQFVASRLAHDAEALIAGLDLQRGEVGGPESGDTILKFYANQFLKIGIVFPYAR
jgi:hypothetical protein